MRRSALHAAAAFFVFMLMQLLLLVPKAQATPGKFLFEFGAPQHLSEAAGVAVDATGKIYVTKIGNYQVFNSSGTRIGNFASYGSADGQLSYPTGIAVDGSGNVFIADTGNSRIEVFDSSGNFVRTWGNANWEQHPPIAVAVDHLGQVYVVEDSLYDHGTYFQGGIKVFNSQGVLLRELGSAGPGPEQYSFASGIAVDKNANVYVLEMGHSRVLLFGPDGTFIKIAVAEIPTCLGIAVDNLGNIYVAGGTPYYFGVDIYNSAGTFIREQTWLAQEEYDQEHYWVPKAIAVDNNQTMYTLDDLDDGLRAFDATGAVLPQWWTYGTGLGQLSSPVGIAVDANGNVYETDADNPITPVINDRVQVFGANGTPLARWVGPFCQTSGIAFKGGNTYVLDIVDPTGSVGCWQATVANVFNSSGTFIGSFGTFDKENFFGIAVDKSGNFVVTDTDNSTLRVYDSQGNFIRNIGSFGSGDGQFYNPKGIAVDAIGNIYVVDSGNNRVQVFNSSYAFIRKWGQPGFSNGYLWHPAGIAVDTNGHVYVADSGNNVIQVFTTSGSFLAAWGTWNPGDDNGQFLLPEGVAVNASGDRVYVADTGNNRIEVFEGFGGGVYTISGTVRQGSSSGPVLTGATVSIAGRTNTTSSTGTFNIAGIPAGTYTLTISKTGYVTKSITGFVVSGNRSGLVYYLQAAYSMSGVVRSGSSTGPVLPGATVSYAGKTTTTSSTGAFTLSGIAAGSYTLTISKPGYATKTTSYYINSNRSGLVFYLTPLYTLSGSVRQGSSSGPVLAGATVSIAGKTAVTSSTGTFSISGIAAGTYTLTLSKAGYATRTITGYVINSNKTGQVFYLVAARGYTIGGIIHQGSSGGPALAGATVSIAGKTTTTSSSGAFSISGVPAGSYTLTISKTGYITKSISGFGVDHSMINLGYYLIGPYALRGTIRQGSPTGPVLSGATISMAGRSSTSTSTGTFTLTGVPAGSFTLKISKTGYLTRTITNYAVSGNKSGLVFYLTK